ncbi:TonB-dependent receptor [Acidobacteria bacterium AH-259-O06]|nr:TonB-dependent receptor [Acidobacteria bacterium AH-259-O06]
MKSAVKQKWVITLILALVAGSGQLLLAQSTFGTILGTATDEQGGVIPGVEVTLTNQNTNVSRTSTTSDLGSYEFLNLLAGTYRVEAQLPGFKTFAHADIQLSSRQIVRVDILMQVGEVSESVTVLATPGLIDSETSSVEGTLAGGKFHFISPTSITQRPWSRMRLNPLVQNTRSRSRFALGGSYAAQSDFQIDGVSAPIGDGRVAGSSVLSSEALEEVKILAVNNKAEYTSPGVFAQISKGGTNAFHGDIYYNLASSALSARRADATSKPVNHTHYFGGRIGGPIIIPGLYDGHEKTFFHLDWMSTKRPGSRLYIADVPTLDMRQGIFEKEIINPFTGEPFTDNRIPKSMINPTSLFFQETFYPPPNAGGPNSTSNNHQIGGPTGTTREELLNLRIDHHFSSNQSMFVRVGGTQFDSQAFDSNLPTVGARARTRKLYTGIFSHNYALLPNLINEFRFGFNRDNRPNGGSNNGLEVIRQAGIQFPASLSPPDTRGFPRLMITGVQRLEQANTSLQINQSYHLTETLGWIKGRHTFKGGINVFKEQPNNSVVPRGAHGQFNFDGTYTGDAYADFLLGIPEETRVAGINPIRYMRATNWGLFLQDDFKMRSNLTLNLGIRWDYQSPPYNKNDAMYNFDPVTGALIKATPRAPVNSAFAAKFPSVLIIEAAEVGMPEKTLLFSDKNNFSPRVGVAWRPGNSSTFVVRAGWGKFTDLLGQGVFARLAQGGFLNRGTLTMNNDRPDSSTGIVPSSIFQFPSPFPEMQQGEAAAGLTVRGFNPHLFNPYIQQWNLTLEKVMFDNIAFRTSYIGTKSTNLLWTRDINQRTIANKNGSRLYADRGITGSIEYYDNGGSSIYHGLQFEVRKRYSDGLAFNLGYTWANNISDVMDQNDRDYMVMAADANNRSLDRGRVPFTRQHSFSAYTLWELPFGHGRHWLKDAPTLVQHVLGGWELYPQLFASSGQWFTPRRKKSNPFTGQGGGSETNRPDRIGDGNDGLHLTGSSGAKWFNPDAFADPPADRLGTAGRSILKGPGFWSFHLSLNKKLPLSFWGKDKEFWLAITAANAFNHPNWRRPATSGELTVGKSAFGSTSTLSRADRAIWIRGREIMVRARIVF